jgi:hypothetical protein
MHDGAGLAQTFTSAFTYGAEELSEEMVGVFKHAVRMAAGVMIVAVVAAGCGGSSSDESSTNAGKGTGGVPDRWRSRSPRGWARSPA